MAHNTNLRFFLGCFLLFFDFFSVLLLSTSRAGITVRVLENEYIRVPIRRYIHILCKQAFIGEDLMRGNLTSLLSVELESSDSWGWNGAY